MLKEVNETVKFLTSSINFAPKDCIILGTGLGGLTSDIDISVEIPYSSIPHFPESTVEGHDGKLIAGFLDKIPVVALKGRFHYYEGYTMQQLTFPVRVLKQLGAEQLFVSNASGGVNPEFEIGDMMIITDHINLFGDNPLIGENYKELGPRFPDMSEAYDKTLIDKALKFALYQNMPVRQGVYLGTTGPTFETPAEYRYFRIIGADAVGMSTVPEIIVARHMGMKCFGISVISDLGVPGKIIEISHDDVQDAAKMAEPQMTKLIKHLLKNE